MEYPHITVTKGLAGFFAVMIWWNAEKPPGFAEPWDSGVGRYPLQKDAIAEAVEWAKREGIPYYPPKEDNAPARQDVSQQIRELIPGITEIHLK